MSESEKRMRVGFVGLGRMGIGMAGRLLDAGHDVTVYNRTPEKSRELVVRGAHLAAHLGDACHGDATITMLADDAAVEDAALGKDGLLESMGRMAIHISMSTISVALSEKLTAAHTGAGQRFVSAPVFGRPDRAAAGSLFIIAAGKNDVVSECMPLFEAMGQKTVRAGEVPRDVNLVKLSGNFIIGSIIEALSEATALARKGGIDSNRYFEILSSTLFTLPLFTGYGGLIARKEYEPALFAAPLGEKDIRLTLAAAESLRAPMPLASLVHDRLQAVIARGGEALDWAAMGKLAANDAGLDL